MVKKVARIVELQRSVFSVIHFDKDKFKSPFFYKLT